jgi:hypothetical protein
MQLNNPEKLRNIEYVVSTMAIEDMPVDRGFVTELVKIANGEKTVEKLIQELKEEYAR